MRLIITLVFITTILASAAFAQVTCLDVEGEAGIVNEDLLSAKTEAIARAKWSAIEQAVGVEVKAQSIVQNMMLVDEAISKKSGGVVTKYTLLKLTNSPDIVSVKVNVCVEPSKAKDAVAGLALNNSLAIFIAAPKPGTVKRTAEYDETNILSETLINKLASAGYTIVDVAPTHAVDAKNIEDALRSGNFISLRSMMYKFLSNIILIGKVEYTVSTRKGTDVGYGIAMPFNNVTARLTYRLISRDSSGKMVILTAGTEQGRGLAINVEDAAANSLKDLSEKITPVVLEKVGSYIKGAERIVRIQVPGVTDLKDTFAVKEVLQNLAWVTNVEEKGLGEFAVSYPENPIYLANSLVQKGNFKIMKYSSVEIVVEYLK
jgi:hypothetical protein